MQAEASRRHQASSPLGDMRRLSALHMRIASDAVLTRIGRPPLVVRPSRRNDLDGLPQSPSTMYVRHARCGENYRAVAGRQRRRKRSDVERRNECAMHRMAGRGNAALSGL